MATALAALALALWSATAAAADTAPSVGVQASVSVGVPLVRSLTVSTPTFQYGRCVDPNGKSSTLLVDPNGICRGGPVSVTVAGLTSHVQVSSTDVTPTDPATGNAWKLCGPSGATPTPSVTCSGPSLLPGTDQVEVLVSAATTSGRTLPTGQALDTASQCDQVASATCAPVAGGKSIREYFTLVGPSLQTDGATSRQHVITWTATP